MSLFHELDAAILLWGIAVLAYITVRHFYFGGLCIQIGRSAHLTVEGRDAASEGNG